MSHVLDRPAWSSLNGRQAGMAVRLGCALRFDPQIGIFVTAPRLDEAALADIAALAAGTGPLALVEADEPPTVTGTEIVRRGTLWQMVAERPLTAPPTIDFTLLALGDADAPEMLALATMTEPGPFFERTHRMGDFIGVREHGRLVAMAGERMRPDGFTEVSAVCTHPDHRGHGYAAALTRIVASRIDERGDTAFLHVYDSNASAIGLYEKLGFRLRRPMILHVVASAQPA